MDKKQKELGDLLKEGAAALVQMRKGIENACTELRTLYKRRVPEPERRDAITTDRDPGNMDIDNRQLPSLTIDKPRPLF